MMRRRLSSNRSPETRGMNEFFQPATFLGVNNATEIIREGLLFAESLLMNLFAVFYFSPNLFDESIRCLLLFAESL
jgi:hypothetical protein